MIIIGEKLNSSIPKTLELLTARDEDGLRELIRQQRDAGADYLDINTAMCGPEEESMLLWLVGLALEESGCGIVLDSPSPAVVRAGLERIKKEDAGRPVILNSVTLTDRYAELTPLAAETGTGVIALPIDGAGIPATAEQRLENALKLARKLMADGVRAENIYVDALAEALSVGDENALLALKTMGGVKAALPEVHVTCGLSNISFGLPKRPAVNSTFLTLALGAGMDSAILDPTSPAVKTALLITNALLGRDEYCMEYIRGVREMEKRRG